MIYIKQTHAAEYDADQSGAVIITPSKGRKINVLGVNISTEGAVEGDRKIKLYVGRKLACTYFPSTVPSSHNFSGLSVKGKRGETVHLTSNIGGGQRFFVAVTYREE